jgi:hypothetical protein
MSATLPLVFASRRASDLRRGWHPNLQPAPKETNAARRETRLMFFLVASIERGMTIQEVAGFLRRSASEVQEKARQLARRRQANGRSEVRRRRGGNSPGGRPPQNVAEHSGERPLARVSRRARLRWPRSRRADAGARHRHESTSPGQTAPDDAT